MSFFNELQASLEETIEIQKGHKTPSRVTRYEIVDIKSIREDLLKVTQVELAAAMGVSVDTIKNWECKRRNPTGLGAKVLATIQNDPSVYAALAAN